MKPSNTGRDWNMDEAVNAWLWSLPPQGRLNVYNLNDLLNHVESVVRKELAAKVEEMKTDYGFGVANAAHFKQIVLSLLNESSDE